MKSFDTELEKISRKIHLKVAERHELRERVLSYMEYHPLPKEKRKLAETITSESFITISFNTIYTRVAAGVFAILLVIGVPIVAERSLPGDVLYLVKTHINEGVRAQFISSPYEKVAFETNLLERRIAEARLLAKEGKLTDEVEAEIADVIAGHAKSAQEGIAALKVEDADEAAIAEIVFGSALDVQSAVLNANATVTVGIAGVVKEAKAISDAVKGTTTPSYDLLMARVEQETTRAFELFQTINESATNEERTDMERRLADIGRVVERAQSVVVESDEGREEAASTLATALGLTQKLIAFMTDIDVRENVELETLVPVVQTTEERVATVETSLNEINTTRALVELRISTITDPNILEKAQYGIDELNQAIDVVVTALAEENVEIAEEAIVGAEAFVSDLDLLTAEIMDISNLNESEGSTSEETSVDPSEFEGEGEEESVDSVISTDPQDEEVLIENEPEEGDSLEPVEGITTQAPESIDDAEVDTEVTEASMPADVEVEIAP